MLFGDTYSVPKDTDKYSPSKRKIAIAKGTIVQWKIFFPPEAANWLYVKVFYHNTSLIPFAGDKWIHGFFDGAPISESIRVEDPPFFLEIHAYNTSTTNSHEYNVYAIIMPDEPVKPETVGPEILARMKSIFGGG